MVHPRNSNVFAKPTDKKTTSTGGMLLTEDAGLDTHTAKVIEVGSDVTDLKPGDVIYYKLYATTDVTIGDETYIIINEEDILGVEG